MAGFNMRQLEGWTLYRALPEMVEADLEVGIEETDDMSGERLALRLKGRIAALEDVTHSFTVDGFYVKSSTDEDESYITKLTLHEPWNVDQIMRFKGDMFGIECQGGSVVSMFNLVLSRDVRDCLAVCAELLLAQSDSQIDAWTLTTPVDAFYENFKSFCEQLSQSGIVSEILQSPTQPSVMWSLGAPTATLAGLGVVFEIEHEVTTDEERRHPLVSLSSDRARVEIYRSKNPSRFEVVRRLQDRAEVELASLSAGPTAASFLCACLAPVRVHRSMLPLRSDAEGDEATRCEGFELVVYRDGKRDDESTYSISDEGVGVKHLRDGKLVEAMANPVDMYIDLLKCFSGD